MTSRHSSETTSSSAANTSCLTAISSNTASITSPHPANAAVSVVPLTIEPRKRALPSASRPRDTCFSRSARTAATASSTRSASMSVITTGTSRRRRNERRELRRHQPRADDADPLDPARLRIRDADSLLDPPLDQVERVHTCLGLRPGQKVGERVLLGRVALGDRPLRRARDQLEGAVGRERDPVHRIVDGVSCLRADLGRIRQVDRRPRGRRRLDRGRTSHSIESSRNSTSSRSASARPSSAARAALMRRFCLSGFATISSTAAAAPTRRGVSCVPPQPGDDPEEDLGEADVAHRAGDRAVVAVEGDLEPAANGGSVDRGERGERQIADLPERFVPAQRRRRARDPASTCGETPSGRRLRRTRTACR